MASHDPIVVGDLVVHAPVRNSKRRFWYGRIIHRESRAVLFWGSTGQPTKARAREWLRAKAERLAGASPTRRMISVGDAATAYIATRVIRPETARDYRSVASRLDARWPTTALDDLTRSEIEKFLASLHSSGRSSRTRAKYLEMLRRICRWGVREGFAAKNPTEGLVVRSRRQREGTPLSPDEFRRLLLATRAREVEVRDWRRPEGWRQPVDESRALRRYLVLAVYTGLRPFEATRLRWRDVELEHGRVVVPAEIAKTKDERRIPIHPMLESELQAGLDERSSTEDPVVASSPHALLRSLGLACARAEIARRTLQDARRTFACWIEERATFSVLQALMGHAASTVTQRYLSITWESRVAAIRALPDFRGQP